MAVMFKNFDEYKIMSPKIILASSSPARKKILEDLGLKFDVAPSDFDERSVNITDTRRLVETLALKKAKTVAKLHKNAIIIGADTMVDYKNRQIGKAGDADEAKKILRFLRGSDHEIITGVAIINTKTGEEKIASTSAMVIMKNYSDETIDAYIATGEPIGKGGAYYWQGLGRKFVIDKIIGEESCAEGMPLSILTNFLNDFGFDLSK